MAPGIEVCYQQDDEKPKQHVLEPLRELGSCSDVAVPDVFHTAFEPHDKDHLNPRKKLVPDCYYIVFQDTPHLDPPMPEYVPPMSPRIRAAFSSKQLNPTIPFSPPQQPDMSHFTPHEQIEYEQYVNKLSKRITRILDSHRVDPRGQHIVDVKDVNLDGEDVFRSSLIDPYILNLLKATQKVLEKNPHM